MKVVVTGANGFLGRRVCARFVEHGIDVVAVDRDAVAVPGVLSRRADLVHDELGPLLAGADAVVHLATCFPVDAPDLAPSADDLTLCGRVLGAVAAAGVRQVVLLSTSMVYGAWPNNPVPLIEDQPLRPNPDFAFAVHKAEVERRAVDWRADHADTALTILRPAVTVADRETSRVDRLLRSVGTIRSDEGDPPAQFLHADDLADAIVVAVENGLDGVANVAPDGWIAPDRLGALAWSGPRPRLPAWVVHALWRWRWRSGLAGAPPGLVAYTTWPWVVGNDRLRALGWQPANSNEEAFVAAHEPLATDKLTARRKQQLSLGIAGAVLAAVLAGVGVVLVRARRRARVLAAGGVSSSRRGPAA